MISVSANGKNELKPLSDYLDHIIDNKEQFSLQKEAEIKNLKNLLNRRGVSLEYTYELNLKLSDEYKKFKVDSALYYATQNVKLAKKLNNTHCKYQSEILLANIYSYSSRSIEASTLLNAIHSKDLPRDLLEEYYETYLRYYEHYAATSNQMEYYYQVENYRDSLLSILDHSTFKYKSNMAHKYIHSGQTDKAEALLLQMLMSVDIDSPDYALVTHYLGIVSRNKELLDKEKQYYTMSAIADIKNAIKENASCQRLALIHYENGDLAKAFKYCQAAIDDALFSGVQFRTAQMSQFYSIINASYQQKEAKTNKELKKYLLLISTLVVCLTLLAIYIYKQMTRLKGVKEELSKSNNQKIELISELNSTNEVLNSKNDQLSESNLIKEQYIAQFFHQCSSYIDILDEYRMTLYKLAINRKHEELIKNLKSNATIETEIEELYAHFDTIFLTLYPTFVSDFNSLLAEEEQIVLKVDGLLTRELRIYALLRLGITDGTLVAKFLRCSLSTVYNYKSMMRNKAAINRDQLEELVMKIGVSKLLMSEKYKTSSQTTYINDIHLHA